VVTELADAFEGDVRAPTLGTGWVADDDDPAWLTSRTGLRYRTRTFTRAAGSAGRPDPASDAGRPAGPDGAGDQSPA
jgi:dihydrofolate reductase